MNVLEGLINAVEDLKKRLGRMEAQSSPRWIYPTTGPLTSTSWDGDSYSTAGKTKIDLSSVFSAPAGIKQIDLRVIIKDSGSAASTTGCWIIFGPDDTALRGRGVKAAGIANDAEHEGNCIIACDSAGDIYYQTNASGASTLDVIIQIMGYLI